MSCTSAWLLSFARLRIFVAPAPRTVTAKTSTWKHCGGSKFTSASLSTLHATHSSTWAFICFIAVEETAWNLPNSCPAITSRVELPREADVDQLSAKQLGQTSSSHHLQFLSKPQDLCRDYVKQPPAEETVHGSAAALRLTSTREPKHAGSFSQPAISRGQLKQIFGAQSQASILFGKSSCAS